MKHIIRKQVIDLGIDSRLDPFSIQHDISIFYWDHIIPLLEKVFNDLCGTNEVICIDKLEIEMGHLAVNKIKQKWEIDKLLAEIAGQLYNKIKSPDHTAIKVYRQQQPMNFFRQWLFYMEWGFLPWNTNLASDDWYKKVLESLATEYDNAEELRKLIRENPRASKRIVLQHPVIYLIQLTELLTARKQDRLPEYIDYLYQAVCLSQGKSKKEITEGKRSFETIAWVEIFLLAAHPHVDLSVENIVSILLTSFLDKTQLKNLSHSKKILAKLSIICPLLLTIVTENSKNQEERVTIKIPTPVEHSTGDNPAGIAKNDDVNKKESLEKGFIDSSQEIKNDIIKTTIKNKEIENTSIEEILHDGIFTNNGGLVLLNHFIYPFFSNLKLLNSEKLIDERHLQKAVHLLQFLATGNQQASEHEMLMAKILCGFPPEESIDKKIQLSPIEITEADHLLNELIAQWEILKNTTPAALREGFLQRKGKLYKRNDHLWLHLEKGSIDMLLDYLPWNISVMKLPWMKERLLVEWR
jgi:hypothetical protein